MNNSFKIILISALILILALSIALIIHLSNRFNAPDKDVVKVEDIEYYELAKKYAEEYRIDIELVLATIDVESSFRKDVVSKAGAIGLMQIMPDTFNDLIERTGENYTTDDLYDPEVNIKYGCYYLRYLIDYFNDVNLSVAAYNAGIGNVNKWIKNSDYYDGESLIVIPFKETQNYCKKISEKINYYSLIIKGDENA